MTQTVKIPPKRQTRRHPMEWKRAIVAQTFEPGASVARVARENNINANQVWAWRRLYAQGLLTNELNPEAMLPVVIDESTVLSAPAPLPIDAPVTTSMSLGSIQIQHGKTSIRIEGTPDSAVLRSVLDRILRRSACLGTPGSGSRPARRTCAAASIRSRQRCKPCWRRIRSPVMYSCSAASAATC
ncbi:IS66-like element accessory protein TnpA [Burkholderia ubonensis]|uniref:IS66-like element accessory protein TnpA n=1 Tax=Burkholderia ubonensis TaxID=101571 RepID=UPI0018DF540C